MTTSNLRDLLRVGDEDEERNNSLRRDSVTLATVLGCAKPDRSSNSTTPTTTAGSADDDTSPAPSRAKTLLDIIRDEDDPPPTLIVHRGSQLYQKGGSRTICWRSVRNRLRLRRVSPSWSSHTTSSFSTNTDDSVNDIRGESTSSFSTNTDDSVGRTGAVAIVVETTTVVESGQLPERPPVSEVQLQTRGLAGRRTLTEENPIRVSLMALLEQPDGLVGSGGNDGDNLHETSAIAGAMIGTVVEEEEEEYESDGRERSTCLCCVCMARQKGAAFIPCGHTFCRPCSRDLWVGRGHCPLCNAFILEILDIF